MGGTRASWRWLLPVDVLLLAGALLLACTLRMGWPPPADKLSPLVRLAPVLLLLPLLFYGLGLYILRRQRPAATIRSVVMAESITLLFAVLSSAWSQDFAASRSVLVIAFGFHLLCVSGWRVLALRLSTPRPQRVLIVAPASEGAQIAAKFQREPAGWFDVVHVTDRPVLESQTLDGIDIIALGCSVVGPSRTDLLRTAQTLGATVYLLPDLNDLLLAGSVGNQVDDAQVFEVRPLALTPGHRRAKRLLDLMFAVPMLLLSAPVMAGVWVAIKLSSPGPALFTQARVGLNGKEFTLFKFRTMILHAEAQTGPVLATANDPRVTPLGRFLRATRLDELPQLYNVLRGDMSLVGPRPERRFFVEQFAAELPGYSLRHLVPPGLTGLAQVMGRYGSTAEDKLRFDLSYARHYSVWLDLKILLLTLKTVMNGLGT